MAKSIKKPEKIYMDFAASFSPNPSSVHELGVNAKRSLEEARGIVADALNARSQEIIFTSGGTESNNLAIQGVVWALAELNFFQSLGSSLRSATSSKKSVPLPHIITTNIEHPSVLETCKLLEKRNLAEVSIVPVEKNGIVDPKKIKKEIKTNTVLVSVMYVNNEIGTIQPIQEIAKEIRHYKKNVKSGSFLNGLAEAEAEENQGPEKKFLTSRRYPLFHTDAVQAVNYLDLSVERLGVDMLSLSGSKIEGTGRVGVLYKKSSAHILGIMGGGDQEYGLRPGTENLSEIIKFSSALKFARSIREKETKRLTQLRDYFLISLLKIFPRSSLPRVRGGSHTDEKFQEAAFLVNGDTENRLPNNVNITFPKIPSDLLVMELSAKGIMASSKSACESSGAEGSYVIKALRPESVPKIGGLRFSFGRSTAKKDIDRTVRALSLILQKLEKWYD